MATQTVSSGMFLGDYPTREADRTRPVILDEIELQQGNSGKPKACRFVLIIRFDA
jgi:hypothetical protein